MTGFTLSPKRIAAILNLLAFGLILWAMFPDFHYTSMVLLFMVLPWGALLIRRTYPDTFRLDWIRKDPEPNLSRFFVVPGFALFICAIRDHSIIDWSLVYVFGIAIAIGVDMIYLKLSKGPLEPDTSRFWRMLMMGFLLYPYGIGVVIEADVLLDMRAHDIYRTVVLGKYVHGDSKHPLYNLRISPWGDVREVRNIAVTHDIYDAANIGEEMCMGQYKGALFISWFKPELCPPYRPDR